MTPAQAGIPLRRKAGLYLDLIRWSRPAGWLLLLWPTLSGLWIAAGGFPGWHLLVVFTLGTILMRSAGCCINDVADREFDRHVKRTAQRPVTTGAISVKAALAFGALLALLAFALVLTTNTPTILWSFAALAITLGRLDVSVVTASYLILMLIWAVALAGHALGAIFYIAIAAALVQVAWHYTLIRTRSREGCFKAFRLNHWLGFTVFAGIALAYALH
jgi:4-hydroxybenzoate polyprenyltransferase